MEFKYSYYSDKRCQRISSDKINDIGVAICEDFDLPCGGLVLHEQRDQIEIETTTITFKVKATPGGPFEINQVITPKKQIKKVPDYYCFTCDKEALFFCKRCRTSTYCSKFCQVIDWRNHKPACNKFH